jgi:hypothetical protein
MAVLCFCIFILFLFGFDSAPKFPPSITEYRKKMALAEAPAVSKKLKQGY